MLPAFTRGELVRAVYMELQCSVAGPLFLQFRAERIGTRCTDLVEAAIFKNNLNGFCIGRCHLRACLLPFEGRQIMCDIFPQYCRTCRIQFSLRFRSSARALKVQFEHAGALRYAIPDQCPPLEPSIWPGLRPGSARPLAMPPKKGQKKALPELPLPAQPPLLAHLVTESARVCS